MQYALNPYVFNDDALQQIWPFLKYYDPSLFKHDYIAQYYLDCMPLGYKGLYILVAKVMDPRVFSKVMIYPLYLFFVMIMARMARRLAGEIGMWACIFLLMSMVMTMGRMTGGLPRTFAFPLISLMLMCLLEKRPWLLALTVVMGSLFYPVAAVIGGVSLACWLLLLDRRNRDLDEACWGLRKRIILVGATGILTVACVSPTLNAASQYGNKIDAQAVKDFPELTVGGRYNLIDSYPFEPLWRSVARPCVNFPMRQGKPWPILGTWGKDTLIYKQITLSHCLLWTFWGVGLLLCLVRAWRDPVYCRLVMYVFICMVLYVVSRAIYPTLYMPARYTEYMLVILLMLMVFLAPVSIGHWIAIHFKHKCLSVSVTIVLCVSGVLSQVNRGDAKSGYKVIDIYTHPVMNVLGNLEPDVMIAGWFLNPIQAVPYLHERSVLVSYELHQLFHRFYALEMRARTLAVIDAYYAQSVEDVKRLRDKMGVTHLLIQRSHFKHTARYFWPYHIYIYERFKQTKMPTLLAGPLKTAFVYEDEHFILLDLRQIQ
ncbi:MAG TPA: hypothetical protein DCM28_10150 [Phycisphaerales bacterium]|nr:hypothetical protein [Phycisphaerales bacterium]HCD32799.1 hypothetical protein [Phycisphaerales bacterium]